MSIVVITWRQIILPIMRASWQMVAGLYVTDWRVDIEYYHVSLWSTIRWTTKSYSWSCFQSNVFTIIIVYCSWLWTTQIFNKNLLFVVGCTLILLDMFYTIKVENTGLDNYLRLLNKYNQLSWKYCLYYKLINW